MDDINNSGRDLREAGEQFPTQTSVSVEKWDC